ncbi:tape measure protein [Acinetobacter johnsonii]|uniref:Tape measure protein n=1 Tax=Acinetobacter johnsonii TaxID=40214 RepID=A0AAJ6IET1_ACIJO|nr:tape measure protein [Acinetobacter johnsonii]WMG19290.1 tape measure protein [Acinetobacter johnsonii]
MVQESVLRIKIDSRGAEKTAQRVRQELQGITTHGEYATKSMDAVSVGIRQLVGQMAGVVTIGAAISKMDAYTGMQNRLKLVTDSQVELNTAMSDTFSIAQKTRSSWENVIQVYQRFQDNAKTLNIDMAKTAELTETVSKAVAISGASTEGANAALVQFGQSLASGVFRGEEFNSVAEQAPGLLKAIATGLGVNIGQLRAMANDGKLTSDILVDALTKSKKSVDELFAKTDVTIGQSLQLLSNEVTKFTGEAGKASGVATTLASSIQILANNLDAIAGIAVVGGVALLTKTIAAQTVAIHGSITAVVARRAADTAALQSQVQLAAVEVQRTRQVTALAAQEIHLARQELNSATTRQARAAATMRLTQAEIAHSIALKQSASAVVAQTAVENALNASRSRSAMLLGLVGGPIGALTIGVAALTAGYMYLKSRTAEANAKLEEQAAVAKKAKDELLALKGLEKDNAINDMAAAFERQNAALSESSSKINMQLNAIEQLYKGNKEVVQVVQDARNGTISMTEAVQRFNELRIGKEVYEAIKANTVEFEKNAKEATNTKSKLNLFGIEVELSGRKAQTAAVGVDEDSKALGKNATAAEKAAEAQKKFKASLFDREFNAGLTKAMLVQGYNAEQINLISEYALKLQKEGKSITVEQVQYLLKINSIEEQNKKVIESRNAAEKERTKELEKQQKVLTASSKVQANAAKYNFSGLESKYGLPSGTLSAIHAIETGNTGKSNQVNSQTGATGGFQFLEGTAKQYGVEDRTDLAQSAEGAAKYMSYLLKLFKGDLEKAVRAYHAGEGNVQKGKNIGKYNNDYWQKFKGYTAGTNGFTAGDVGSKDWEKLLEEAAKMAEQQAELRKNLELNVADEVTRIRSKLADDLQEIDKAGFSPEETKRLTAEYQARADNDIAIAEYALKTKLDDYESFRKTESQLLEDSFNERKFYASRDLELTKEQRDKAVALLDEQLKQEQALMKLAYETRIFQYKEALMAEAEFVRERYRIEMLELSKIVDIEERRIAMQAKTTAFIRGNLAPVGTPVVESDKGKSNTQLLQEETGRELQAMQNRHLAAQVAAKDNAEELLRIERDYIAAKEQLHTEHNIKLADARQADFENQFSMYSSMISMTGGVFNELMGIVSEYKEENTKTYKTMFAFQKAIAIAQGIVSTELAAVQVMSDPTALTMAQKLMYAGMVRATGYASVGVIASQMFAGPGGKGYANGGFTGYGGKYEPAGIVHKWEGVLTKEEMMAIGGPQGFEGLRKSIKDGSYANGGIAGINAARDTHRVGMGAVNAINSGGSGGKAVIQPKVVINNYSSEKVETSTNQDGELMVTIGKMLDQKIDTGVDRGIQRNLRQGYPLANAIKGR